MSSQLTQRTLQAVCDVQDQLGHGVMSEDLADELGLSISGAGNRLRELGRRRLIAYARHLDVPDGPRDTHGRARATSWALTPQGRRQLGLRCDEPDYTGTALVR